jgi:SAM-dependent methyltransferase
MEANKKSAAIELFLLSMVSLYFELLIIRWMSADIRAFAVFRTLPLITCFIGLGVGFAFRSQQLYRLTPFAILQFVVTMVLLEWFGIGLLPFPTTNVYYWQDAMGQTSPLYLAVFMLILMLLLSGPFALMACIGSRLGLLFNKMKPLNAYCINIAGAIIGSLVFPLVSFLEWSPWQLLIPGILPLAVCYPRQSRRWLVTALAVMLLVPATALIAQQKESLAGSSRVPELKGGAMKAYWSPYQRVDLGVLEAPTVSSGSPAFLGLVVGANHSFYQYFFSNRKDLKVSPGVSSFLAKREGEYAVPYLLTKADDVLVVGAGTGQNVSSAIDWGAKSVDAVDIDPVILKFGKRFNPTYSEPRVHLVCDDARHFFRHCQKKYDLINFSLLDSQAVTGQGSSVRVDTYVYTQESIKSALNLLKPDGLLVLSFSVVHPWMGERLFNTLKSAAGYDPLVFRNRDGNLNTFFVLGRSVKEQRLALPDDWKSITMAASTTASLSDDWPYLYVRNDLIDIPYLLIVCQFLLLAAFAGRKFLFVKSDPANWQMFFMGAAFMLLELHAISFLSLLYGSTWTTSAIVINGILVMILLANVLVIKVGNPLTSRQPIVYAFLFLSILASYFLPSSALLTQAGTDDFITYALVTTITILPLALAGIIFSSAFARVSDAGQALAYNLFGALIGGLLEYLSNYTGIRNLELVGLALYAASMWFAVKAINSGPPEEAPETST